MFSSPGRLGIQKKGVELNLRRNPQSPQEPADRARFYRPELDGLRFFAFLSVYLTHTTGFGIGGVHHRLPEWLGEAVNTVGAAGIFGVDLFFVLSSYLITVLLLREREERGHLDIWHFYVRRALRIWPVYFFVIGIALCASLLVASEQLPPVHLLGFLFFCGNWPYMLSPINSIAAPLWSVSVEEQFYLVWPWVVRRANPRAIGAAALVIFALGIGACFVMQSIAPLLDWVTKNSFTRIDGIAVGALIALYQHERSVKMSAMQRNLVLLAAVATLLGVAHSFGLFDRPVPTANLVIGWILVAVACGAILLCAIGCEGWMRKVLTHHAVIYLGRISFGLYAYHELTLRLLDSLLPAHSHEIPQMFLYWFGGLALTFAAAAASYRWLEMPFLRLKQKRFTMVQSRPDAN